MKMGTLPILMNCRSLTVYCVMASLSVFMFVEIYNIIQRQLLKKEKLTRCRLTRQRVMVRGPRLK